MHELGIARDLWADVCKIAKENKFKTITKIHIMIGETSGFEEDFLRHSLVDHVLKGTIAESALVLIENEKLKAKCGKCSAEILKDTVTHRGCPACGNLSIDIVSGRDTYVKTVEGK